MKTGAEEKFLDVLRLIETAIVTVYRDNPAQVSDWTVENALDQVIRHYTDEVRGRPERSAKLEPIEQEMYNLIFNTCEWRMGRGPQPALKGRGVSAAEREVSPSDILMCLKQVRRSVAHWHKTEGRRGYLDFVRPYIS